MIVIEHNLDVIKTADWLIDLGPEGGSGGGTIVAEGTPEQVAAEPDVHTGSFLRTGTRGSGPVGTGCPGSGAPAPTGPKSAAIRTPARTRR